MCVTYTWVIVIVVLKNQTLGPRLPNFSFMCFRASPVPSQRLSYSLACHVVYSKLLGFEFSESIWYYHKAFTNIKRRLLNRSQLPLHFIINIIVFMLIKSSLKLLETLKFKSWRTFSSNIQCPMRSIFNIYFYEEIFLLVEYLVRKNILSHCTLQKNFLY